MAACSSSGQKSPTAEAYSRATANFAASVRVEMKGTTDADRYTDDELGGFGLHVCDFLDSGGGGYDAARRDLVNQGVSESLAPAIVGAALVNFCPAYIGADLGANSG
jgi:hypothetical protein